MAITDANLWQAEEQLWTGGVDRFGELVADECLMVFPTIGVMDREAAMEGLSSAPRWSDVSLRDRSIVRAGKQVAVLAYRADATRGDERFAAYCSSTYRGGDDGWKLVQHQQTVAN